MRSLIGTIFRSFLACALIAAGASPLAASANRFLRLGVAEGVSHTTVWDVAHDSRGFVWLATETSLQRYDGYEFKDYVHDPLDPSSLSAPFPINLLVDRSGRLWVYCETGGIDRYDRDLDRFERFALPPDVKSVVAMTSDSKGDIWLIAFGVGVLRFDPVTGTSAIFGAAEGIDPEAVFEIDADASGTVWAAGPTGLFRLRDGAAAFDPVMIDFAATGGGAAEVETGVDVLSIAPDGRVWLGGTDGGIYVVDPDSDRAGIAHTTSESFTELSIAPNGHLWFSVANGLFVYEPDSGQFRPMRFDVYDADGLSSAATFGVSFDRRGRTWVGTRDGVSVLDPDRSVFEVWRARGDGKGLSEGNAQTLMSASDGSVWIGMATGAVSRWDPTSDEMELVFDVEDGPVGSIEWLSAATDGRIILGGERGLAYIDPDTRPPHVIDFYPDLRFVRGVTHGPSGETWLASLEQGVVRIEDGVVDLAPIEIDGSSVYPAPAYAIFSDRLGQVWVGTYGGVLRIDPVTRRVDDWARDENDPTSPGGDLVSAFHEDASGRLWVATYGGGLDRFDRKREIFEHYTEHDGLANNFVVSILESDDGLLWISTNRGLSSLDPRSGEFQNYFASDGLASDVFLLGGSTALEDGRLAFSGHDGVTLFDPARLRATEPPPDVVLTELRVSGTPVVAGEESSPLARAFSETDAIDLAPHQDTFSIGFSALESANPARTRFEFRLEGLDDGWSEVVATNRWARYTDLRPGKYLFHVRASNRHGLWGESSTLAIRVRPPWWRTPWAYALYVALFLGALLGYAIWQQRRLDRERAIAQRLREVDLMKNEFLANTSHEIRTPLFGITGLADSLIDGARGPLDPGVAADLDMIVSSGRRLSSLVDDILDFSRLQDREVEIDLTPVNLPSLVELVLTLSRPLADGKEVELVNAVPRNLPSVQADENRLQQILLNLVGNAIKFTDRGSVVVTARIHEERVTVDVEDTGIGIASDQIDRIFAPFEQVESSAERRFGGTGLGLAITRDLVALHGSDLVADSVLGEGSRFRFWLSVSGAKDSAEVARPSVVQAPTPSRRSAAQPGGALRAPQTTVSAERASATILVVDDEPVVRQVLVNQLSSAGYRVLEASSGPEALRLLDTEPDLVLLDIMMPRMSGFEVCDSIRQKYAIDRLPVIYLSAKSQLEDLLHGFSTGANDYVSKPVNKDELIARIRIQLELRELHAKLKDLLAERSDQVERLEGLLPICASCKKIRDDDGYWQEVERFLDKYSDASFTHGLCEHCVQSLYPDLAGESERSPTRRSAE